MYQAQKILIGLNSIVALYSFVVFVYGTFIVANGGRACADEINCVVLPSQMGVAGLISGLLLLFISLGHVYAVYKHSKVLLLPFTAFTGFAFISSIFFAVLAFLIGQQQGLGDLRVVTDAIETEMGSLFLNFAVTEPEQWVQVQDNLECCGLSLKAPLLINITNIHTGSNCDPLIDQQVLGLLTQNPEIGLLGREGLEPFETIINEANDNKFYFCDQVVIEGVREAGAVLGGILFVVSLLQLAVFALSTWLLFFAPVDLGGFDFSPTGKRVEDMSKPTNNNQFNNNNGYPSPMYSPQQPPQQKMTPFSSFSSGGTTAAPMPNRWTMNKHQMQHGIQRVSHMFNQGLGNAKNAFHEMVGGHHGGVPPPPGWASTNPGWNAPGGGGGGMNNNNFPSPNNNNNQNMMMMMNSTSSNSSNSSSGGFGYQNNQPFNNNNNNNMMIPPPPPPPMMQTPRIQQQQQFPSPPPGMAPRFG